MPEVIKAMVEAGMISHNHIERLAAHFLDPRGSRISFSSAETASYAAKQTPAYRKSFLAALEYGTKLGLVKKEPASSKGREEEYYHAITPEWARRVRAYLNLPGQK